MKKKFFFLLAIPIIIIVSCAPDPYKQSYEKALQLAKENNIYDAYSISKELCKKMPAEKEYCDLYKEVSKKLYNIKVKEISQKIASSKALKPLIPVPTINELYKDYGQIEELGLKTKELENIKKQIDNEKELTEGKKNQELLKAEEQFKNNNFVEAIKILEDIKELDKTSITEVINEYKEKAMKNLYPKIKEIVNKGDWNAAHKLIKEAYLVNPDYKDIKELLNEAKEKDTGEYNLKMADEARKTRKYESAMAYYQRAAKYPETKEVAEQQYYKTKIELCDYYFLAGIELMEQDLNKQAFDNFKKAFEIIETLPIEKRKMVKVPKKELQKYYDTLYLKAKKAEDTDNLGLAYQYYKLIEQLSPSYPDIKENLRKVEEKIMNRAMKSIAVIPFKSPKANPEAGNMFTSAIMMTLYNELRQDMKIIERESMDVLLREYELTVAGKNVEKPKDSSTFQITSADYLLLGDVLEYRVDTSVQEGTKVVRVKTKVEFVPNPEYDEWVENAKKLQQKGLAIPPSPPKLIEKPFYEDIKYKVTYYKKVGMISVSYRIVDATKGKIVHTGLVEIKKDVNDESSEGVEIGEFRIPFKMAQLPTDSELIKIAQEEAVKKIASDVKAIFKEPEEKYIKQAEQLEKDNNIQEAIERYTDAIIISKKKGKDTKAFEERLSKYIDVVTTN